MLSTLDPVEIGFVAFLIFAGVGVRLFVVKDTEKLGLAARIYSQFAAVVVLGALAIMCLVQFKLNVLLVGILGFFTSLGMAKFIILVARWFDKQTDPIEIIERLGSAIKAFYTILKSPDKTKTDD